MATINQRPGVTVTETLLAANTTAAQSDALEAFVGVLPQGPIATPVLITSFTQFRKVFGGFVLGGSNVVAHAVYQFFANGGSRCFIVRVVGAGATAAHRTFNNNAGTPAAAVVLTAANPGAWGNTLYAEWVAGSSPTRATLNLRLVPAGASISPAQIVETWTDVSLNPADTRYVLRLLNDPISGSTYVTAALAIGYSYAANDVMHASSVAGGDPLTAGADGSAPALGATGDYVTAVSLLDVVQQPFVLNLPTITDTATINSVLAYADASLGGRGDVFVVIDTDPGLNPAQAIAASANYTDSSYGAVYYPRIVVSDPSTTIPGSTITVAPGGAVLGQYAATDAQRGVFKSPAGNTTRISTALAVETVLTNSNLDALNVAGVNAIRSQPGSGICIMGARTLLPDPADKYIAVRRTLIFIESQLSLVSQFAIFEPNDTLLWNHLQAVCAAVLVQLWQAGGLTGNTQDQAFYVVCDDSTNTVESIANGQVNIQVGVALEYPAEFIVINIGQFDGGTTVVEQTAA